MKTLFFLFVILIELFLIIVLAQNINQKNASRFININPSLSDTNTHTKIDGLEYFFEPKPNTIQKPELIFEGLENISYTINNDGLNQLENYSVKKGEGIYRIVMLGDSFTFGANVNTKDNFPSQLKQLLDKELLCHGIKTFEVLNLGVKGYDIQYSVERFNLRGKKYDPDLIIWFIIPDDFSRINELLRPKGNKYRLKAIQNGQHERDIANGHYYSEWRKAKSEIVQQLGGESNLFSWQKKNMQQLNKLYSGRLILTTFQAKKDSFQKTLQEVTNERKNTFFYNHLPDINKIPDATLPDLHPSKKGHTVIANSILHYLVNKGILSCVFK